jgi:hypothetical protein
MTNTRRAHEARGDLRVRAVLGALVLTATTNAAAEGEKTPMFGAAVIGASAPEHEAELAGVALEAVWWRGWIGLAAEGSMRWDIAGEGARATVAGASLRIRLLEYLLPSLLEPCDVAFGIELHGIFEHTWWVRDLPQQDSNSYGVGLAVRLRGGGDDDSSLLAESRLFVRVMSSRWETVEAVARTTAPIEDRATRELTVLIGIGASFGAGEPGYVERFRMRPFDPAALRLRSMAGYRSGIDD